MNNTCQLETILKERATSTFTWHFYFIRCREINKEWNLTILGCEQAEKTGWKLQRYLKRPIYVFLSDLSKARQTTEILTKNLTQDNTITCNNILQEVGLIRIDTSLTRNKDQGQGC